MKPRTKQQKIERIQQVLESYRRFDMDYIPYIGSWWAPGSDYPYRQRGWDRFWTGFWRTLMFLFGWILIGVCFGARVTGRKNLKAIKKSGAVSICNHINYLDTLFIRQAVGHYRSYHTMGPQNNKRGFGGWVVRHGGMLPFSTDLSATRNLNKEIGRLLEEGKIVNFYAEQALWTNYQKPRPMKDGAFHYALKHNVPVLPIFCTFRKTRRGHMRKLRIHILPAVYADESLPRKERLLAMKAQAQAEWQACYEEAYGIPLEYLPDRRKHAPLLAPPSGAPRE